MTTFTYHDKNGQNEIGAEGYIRVDREAGVVHIGADYGDMDGDCSYTLYVPNHRQALEGLIADLQEVLITTAHWEEGYDGFYLPTWSAYATNVAPKWRKAGTIYGD